MGWVGVSFFWWVMGCGFGGGLVEGWRGGVFVYIHESKFWGRCMYVLRDGRKG